MVKNITIDSTRCIQCQKCIKICPQRLFHTTPSLHIEVNVRGCISCGHCVAICTQNAISHSDFPLQKIQAFDQSNLPNADQVELLIKARRSNRAFSSKTISDEILRKIITAAHFAPTASNQQEIKIIAITNHQILQQISSTTINNLGKQIWILNNPFVRPLCKRLLPQKYKYTKVYKRIKAEYCKGYDHILRNAQAVILFYTDECNGFACQDANLAYQNASLMAETMGIAHFYTGFVCKAAELDKKQKLQKILHINGKIYAGMALGIPLFKFKRYIEKNNNDYVIIK